MKSEYDRVKKTLQAKLALFAGAEQKDGLQNRANRLANNVSDKLKELQGIRLMKYGIKILDA